MQLPDGGRGPGQAVTLGLEEPNHSPHSDSQKDEGIRYIVPRGSGSRRLESDREEMIRDGRDGSSYRRPLGLNSSQISPGQAEWLDRLWCWSQSNGGWTSSRHPEARPQSGKGLRDQLIANAQLS